MCLFFQNRFNLFHPTKAVREVAFGRIERSGDIIKLHCFDMNLTQNDYCLKVCSVSI